MDALLLGNSANKGEEGHRIIEISKVEVFLLKFSLGGDMVRCLLIELLQPRLYGHAVGEGKWPLYPSE